MIITHSSLECFKSCRHKYKLRYLDGIVPKKKSDALLFGSAMHAVLEQYFKRIDAMQTFGNNNEPKDEVCKSVCNTIESIGIEKIEAAKLKGLMLGYVSKWYNSDCQNFNVIAIEKEFNIPIIDVDGNVRFVGKIDGLVQSKEDRKYYILEHKTAAVVDESYIAQKQIDSQTKTYAYCIEQMLGIRIHGIIHDIITKQKIRQKKGESEDEFCGRLVDDVTDDNFTRIVIEIENRGEFEKFIDELMSASEDLQNCGNFYKCTGSCIGRFGACEYLDLCRSGGLADSIREKYEITRPHEEISTETLEQTEE